MVNTPAAAVPVQKLENSLESCLPANTTLGLVYIRRFTDEII